MCKKVISINSFSFGSTGKIMLGIEHVATSCGYEAQSFVSTNGHATCFDCNVNSIHSKLGYRISEILNKLTGFEGCFAIFATLKAIKKIDKFRPDVIHLHNLHHGYINLPILFKYLKKKKLPIIWTLHDCWSFTGHCPHFIHENCDKWKTGCHDCPKYKEYPKSITDNSKLMWKLKKRWFTGVSNLTLITPSIWLNKLVEQSFLNEYPRFVVNNGIDLSIFKPTRSKIREKYNVGNKKIILGVASTWSTKKGIDVFQKLANNLPEDVQIILVGTDDNIDKILPANIISVHRTENQTELAAFYTEATLFVNPTREDTYPTVNMEALACGTPVLTFKTGGSPEIIDETCGLVVECDDINSLEREILNACNTSRFKSEDCLKRAQAFNQQDRFKDYVKLYSQI